MIYENSTYPGDMFLHFLLDNPDILQNTSALTTCTVDVFDDDDNTAATLSQRLEEWLERETHIVDPTHRVMLLQLATSYEAIAEMRDTLTTFTGR